MTGKSGVIVARMLRLLAAAAICAAAGCSLFEKKDDPLDYQAMRRQVEGYRQQNAQVDYEEPETAKKKEDKGLLSGLVPEKLNKNVRKLAGLEPDPKAAKGLFAEAEEKYRQALAMQDEKKKKTLFSEAGDLYAKAAKSWPDSAIEQNGLFLAGESYFFSDRYPHANDQYELLLKKYPNARQIDVVEARRFAIAQFWLQLEHEHPHSFFAINFADQKLPWNDTQGHAVRIFDRIRLDDPTGKFADDATLARANAYFLRGDYIQADDAYTDLRKTFPSSEHQFKAHFLGLKCKLETYQGPEYDGTALDEAERLIKTIRKQFPQEAEQERKYLTEAWAEVRYKKAQRDWVVAQYYERRREYGGARFHYLEVIKNFDDTPFAERARKRIKEIEGLPDVPPQQLQWLVNLFPKSTGRAQPLFQSDSPVRK